MKPNTRLAANRNGHNHSHRRRLYRRRLWLFLSSTKVDADTSVPYCVVGSVPSASGSSGRFFNLVVCHDLFDNYERMKIVVAPVIARYPGAQVRRSWRRGGTPIVSVVVLSRKGLPCHIARNSFMHDLLDLRCE